MAKAHQHITKIDRIEENQVVETLSTAPTLPKPDTLLDQSCLNRSKNTNEQLGGERTVRKRRQATDMPSKELRYDRTDHLPEVRKSKSRNRCRYESCDLKTNNFCIKCEVYLCIKDGKSCFANFHTPQ